MDASGGAVREGISVVLLSAATSPPLEPLPTAGPEGRTGGAAGEAVGEGTSTALLKTAIFPPCVSRAPFSMVASAMFGVSSSSGRSESSG